LAARAFQQATTSLASSTVARRQRVDRELGDGFVRPRIWLVVEDVHCAVPDLEKIDVAGDRGLGVSGEKPDAGFLFERGDVVLGARIRTVRAVRIHRSLTSPGRSTSMRHGCCIGSGESYGEVEVGVGLRVMLMQDTGNIR
jgi:hypothetical protein